jgi:hypothetical protein
MIRKLNQNFRSAWRNPNLRQALLIAMASDVLGFAVILLPPVQWALDAVTALLLLVILGFRWQLFLALIIEIVPFLEVFPAWTLVVIALAAQSDREFPNGR